MLSDILETDSFFYAQEFKLFLHKNIYMLYDYIAYIHIYL